MAAPTEEAGQWTPDRERARRTGENPHALLATGEQQARRLKKLLAFVDEPGTLSQKKPQARKLFFTAAVWCAVGSFSNDKPPSGWAPR